MKKIKRLLLYVILVLYGTSCIDNVDFNQVEDLSVEPAFITTLAYFTLNQNNFIFNGIEINTVTDISDFKVLNNAAARESLKRIVFDFAINNQFDRDFNITIDFLDKTNTVVHNLAPLTIKAYDNNFSEQRAIAVTNNQQFLSATKVSIKLQMYTGIPFNPNDVKTLDFKSAATVYLKLN